MSSESNFNETILEDTDDTKPIRIRRSSNCSSPNSSCLDSYFSRGSIFQTNIEHFNSSSEGNAWKRHGTFSDEMFLEINNDSNIGVNYSDKVTKQLRQEDAKNRNGKTTHSLDDQNDSTEETKRTYCSHKEHLAEENKSIDIQPRPERQESIQVLINVELCFTDDCNSSNGSTILEVATKPIPSPGVTVGSPIPRDVYFKSVEVKTRSSALHVAEKLGEPTSIPNVNRNSKSILAQDVKNKQTTFKRFKTRNKSESTHDNETELNENSLHNRDQNISEITCIRRSSSCDSILQEKPSHESNQLQIPEHSQRMCSSANDIFAGEELTRIQNQCDKQRLTMLKNWYSRLKEKKKPTYHFVRRLNLPCPSRTGFSPNIVSAIAAVGKDSFWIGIMNSPVIKLCSMKGKVKSSVDIGDMVDDVVTSNRGDLYISCPKAKCIKVIKVENPSKVSILVYH